MSERTTTLRTATIADIDAIMAIENASFPTDAWNASTMQAEITDAVSSRYLVAIDDSGAIVGYAGLRAVPGLEQADIQTIAVSEAARGRGLGRALLRELLDEAGRRGATEVLLEVRADNPVARGLYEAHGFVEIAVRPRYYPGGVDAHVLRLTLEPTGVLVLGIETSCDETGIGIVRGDRLLANVIASSMDEHARFGGVVPEVAARAHLEALTPAIEQAMAEAGVGFDELDAIAVTNGPGLAGALMVGVGAAKALAIAIDRPLYAVNHLVGHVGADVLSDDGALEMPTVALLVSGGHTSLLLVRDLLDDVELLGETIDDAAGEAFDKVARLLGLPYPGGPWIDRVAADGDATAIRFPRGLTAGKDRERHRWDFSFSGLKTAVARRVEQDRDAGREVPVADIAASFREAVIDVLTAKAVDACLELGVPRLLLGGGVVANARLREVATERCAAAGIALRIPPLSLCTDNGAMIAALGAQLVAAGRAPSGLDFGADSSLPVTVIQTV